FILTHTYLGAVPDRPLSRRGFWVARFARIYPVYLLSILLAMPFSLPATAVNSPVHTATTFGLTASLGQLWTLLPSILFGHPHWSFAVATLDWNFPTWSLGCEVFFYALFPAFAPALARARTRTVAATLGLSWLAAIAPPLIYRFAIPGATYPSDHAI